MHLNHLKLEKLKTNGLLNKKTAVFAVMLAISFAELLLSVFVKTFDGDYETFSDFSVIMWLVFMAPIAIVYFFDGDIITASLLSFFYLIGFTVQSMLNNGSKFSILMIISSVFGYVFAFILIKYAKEPILFRHFKLFFAMCAISSCLIFATILLLGHKTNSATLSVSVMGQSLQIGEFLKIIYGIMLATILANKELNGKKKIIISVAMLCVFSAGYLAMNELGSLLVVILVTTIMNYIFISDRRILIIFFSVSVLAAFIAVIYIFTLYKLRDTGKIPTQILIIVNKLVSRWTIHINPVGVDAFQILRGVSAIKVGGMFGSNSHIYTPLYESDMVFVYIILRFGVLLALMLAAAYFVFFVSAQKISERCNNQIQKIMCFYMGTIVFIQAYVIMFGSTNYTMLTGIPLPFISQGGASLMCMTAFATTIIVCSCKKNVNLNKSKPKSAKHRSLDPLTDERGETV